LEALRDTVTARAAVLSDAQVLAVVGGAYDISESFGLYVQTHAETGARSSQLARCVVADLERDRLMMPTSHKGRGIRKIDRTPVTVHARAQASAKTPARGSPRQCAAAHARRWRTVATENRGPQRPIRAGGTCGQTAGRLDHLRPETFIDCES